MVESQSSDACQTGLTAGLTILGVGVIVLLCILVVLLLVHVVRRKKPSLKPASAPGILIYTVANLYEYATHVHRARLIIFALQVLHLVR